MSLGVNIILAAGLLSIGLCFAASIVAKAIHRASGNSGKYPRLYDEDGA